MVGLDSHDQYWLTTERLHHAHAYAKNANNMEFSWEIPFKNIPAPLALFLCSSNTDDSLWLTLFLWLYLSLIIPGKGKTLYK